MRIYAAGFIFATALAVSAASLAASHKADPPLWTPGQREVETLALSFRQDPAIQAARNAVVKLYEQAPSAQLADGKSRLEGAVDELLQGVLLATVTRDPAHPELVWSETLSYTAGDRTIPASRYAGDTPDRIYRNVVVDPAYRYELRGSRSKNPSLDFSFEAIPGPANWGLPPLAILQAKDMDIADDGSFVVTIDATSPNGRRNHLQLLPGTVGLLLRDTIADWGKQSPNELSLKGLDDAKSPPRTRKDIVKHSAQQLEMAAKVSLKFYAGIWRREVNKLDTYVRDLGWGIVAINRFSLKDDEALLVTIDPVSARYFGLQVDDLWLRSAEYVEHSSSLNNLQAKPNLDGSFTFVVSKEDPGFHNWIDTDGMNDGFLVGRWEMLSRQTKGDGAVREVRRLKLSELASALPADAARVSPAERRHMLEARKASYQSRLIKE